MFKERKRERWKVMSHASQKRRASSCVQFENLDFLFLFSNLQTMTKWVLISLWMFQQRSRSARNLFVLALALECDVSHAQAHQQNDEFRADQQIRAVAAVVLHLKSCQRLDLRSFASTLGFTVACELLFIVQLDFSVAALLFVFGPGN